MPLVRQYAGSGVRPVAATRFEVLAGAAKLEEYCLPLSIPLGCQRWIGSLSFRINNGSKLSQKCAARMQMSHDAAGTWIGDRQTRIFADHPRPTKHVSIAMQAQPGPCENVYVPFPDYIIINVQTISPTVLELTETVRTVLQGLAQPDLEARLLSILNTRRF